MAYHLGDELGKRVLRSPAEHGHRLRRVADQLHGLGWAEKPRIDRDMIAVVQSDLRERELAEFTHGVRLAGGQHVIVRYRLLQHQMHAPYIIRCVPPVAPRVQVAEPQLVREPQFDTRHGGRDLTRDELVRAPWPLVVEEDARAAEHAELLTVTDGEVVPGDLADAVRAAGADRRGLRLRRPTRTAEHLAGAGEVQPALRLRLA